MYTHGQLIGHSQKVLITNTAEFLSRHPPFFPRNFIPYSSNDMVYFLSIWLLFQIICIGIVFFFSPVLHPNFQCLPEFRGLELFLYNTSCILLQFQVQSHLNACDRKMRGYIPLLKLPRIDTQNFMPFNIKYRAKVSDQVMSVALIHLSVSPSCQLLKGADLLCLNMQHPFGYLRLRCKILHFYTTLHFIFF